MNSASVPLLSPTTPPAFLLLVTFLFLGHSLSWLHIRILWASTIPMRILIWNNSWEPLICLVSMQLKKHMAGGIWDVQPLLRAVFHTRWYCISRHELPPSSSSLWLLLDASLLWNSVSPQFLHISLDTFYISPYFISYFLCHLFCLFIQITREQGICKLQSSIHSWELLLTHSLRFAPGFLIIDR